MNTIVTATTQRKWWTHWVRKKAKSLQISHLTWTIYFHCSIALTHWSKPSSTWLISKGSKNCWSMSCWKDLMTILRLFIRILSMGILNLGPKTMFLSNYILKNRNHRFNKRKKQSNLPLSSLKIKNKSSLIHSPSTNLSFKSLLKRLLKKQNPKTTLKSN